MNTQHVKKQTHVCLWCRRPSDDREGLVRRFSYYEHPSCSPENYLYERVTQLSFPDDETEVDDFLEWPSPEDKLDAEQTQARLDAVLAEPAQIVLCPGCGETYDRKRTGFCVECDLRARSRF